MSSSPLRTRLQAAHHLEPQVGRKVDLAMLEIEAALRVLAAAGHQFHLEPGPESPDVHDWPRLYFHITAAPNGRLVRSRYDLADLGGEAYGWYPTLELAQHADAYATQLHGKAGITSPARELTITKGASPHDHSPPRASREALISALRRAAETRADSGGG